MNVLLDLAVTAIALPGLFLAAAAPWLDWIIPLRDSRA
jgi:hypothetical protein